MKTIVLSVGGSIIVPDSINTDFLKGLKEIIVDFTKEGSRVIIITGGGSTARKYQGALKEIIGDNKIALDWMGISATHLNAFLVKGMLNGLAEEEVVQDPTADITFDKPVLIAGGWKPGWSTDYDAVLLAEKFNADTVINMSNISHVYDSDPKKNPDAKPLEEMSWDQMKELVGDEWVPGKNVPFDPSATKKAAEMGLKVITLDNDLENFKLFLEGKEFKGTTIK